MEQPVKDAIVIMNALIQLIAALNIVTRHVEPYGIQILIHAIRHIARPERDVYPKMRDVPKGSHRLGGFKTAMVHPPECICQMCEESRSHG